MHIHHGQKSENPIEKIRFYNKNDDISKSAHENGTEAIGYKIDVRNYTSILPRSFEDKKIRVFARKKDNVNIVRRAFEKWCQKHVNPLPLPFPSSQTDTTPIRNSTSIFNNSSSTSISPYKHE